MNLVLYVVNVIRKEHNFKISTVKTRFIALKGSEHTRAEIVVENKVTEQRKYFKYSGCSVQVKGKATPLQA
jgi:carbonic anhydrase